MSKKNPYTFQEYVRNGHLSGRLRFELRDMPITIAAAGAGVAFGTKVVGELPTGLLHLAGASCKLAFRTTDTDLTATWNGDYAFGTAPDADGSLATVECDLIGPTAIGPAASRVIAPTIGTHTGLGTAAYPKNFNNSNGNAEVNLNLLADAADFTDAGSAIILVNGVLDIYLTAMGVIA